MTYKKQPDSLRSLGRSSINCDRPTRDRLKQLAGDTPLAYYLRELAEKESRDKQLTMPGGPPLPHGLSDEAIKKRLSMTLAELLSLTVGLPYAVANDVTGFKQAQENIADTIDGLVAMVKAALAEKYQKVEASKAQSEFELKEA